MKPGSAGGAGAGAGTLLGPEPANYSGLGCWPTGCTLLPWARRPDFFGPARTRGHSFACSVVTAW